MQIIKTALCSFGMSGKIFHAPFIQLHEGFELVGAWERSTNVFAHHYPKTKSYDSLEELLADDIDLVIVNTPNNTHYDFAKIALLADKHVVVEKPFTNTTAEGEALQFLAKQQELTLAVYQNKRWESDFKTVKKIVENKYLGNIIEAEIRFDRYRLEISQKGHKEIPSSGAGMLNDIGPHLIDQAICLFGKPNKVFAELKITRPQSKVVDYFKILLDYEAYLVTLTSSCIVKEPQASFVLHGTNGSFIKHKGDMQEQLLLANKKPNKTNWAIERKEHYGLLHYEKNGKWTNEKVKSELGNYYDFYDQLYHAIVNKNPIPVNADEGIFVIKILEAAKKSHEQQEWIQL